MHALIYVFYVHTQIQKHDDKHACWIWGINKSVYNKYVYA